MRSKQPHPVDVYVGKTIREARIFHGLSRSALAELIGITFQQLQKYEIAANRVSCSRLYGISRILNVPIHAFFTGGEKSESGEQNDGAVAQPEILGLVKAYNQLDPAIRKSVARVAASLADWARGAQ
jgi:transcriptional regulator with XRE-family HTH domain